MNARHREPAGRGRARRIARGDFPALASFLSGYLHEDFVPEYGSAGEAAGAFLAEAGPDERRQVRDELRRLLARTDGWARGDLQRALTSLGGAWAPADRAELETLLARWDQE